MVNDEKTRVINNASNKAKAATDGKQTKLPLGKVNFILIAISLILIVIGFIMMSGSSNTGKEFNYAIFDNSRIVVAPFITFIGFLLMAPALLIRGKRDKSDNEININNDN